MSVENQIKEINVLDTKTFRTTDEAGLIKIRTTAKRLNKCTTDRVFRCRIDRPNLTINVSAVKK